MTEKEKMCSGRLYDAYDASLLEERERCRLLCESFNRIAGPDADAARGRLLPQLVGRCGVGCKIQPAFWCNYGWQITLGDHFYMNHNGVMLDCAPITIGSGVMVGPNCGFYTAGHPLDPQQRAAGLQFARPITVGDRVWIGGNVVILPGVTIGDDTVVGAGSVVTHDLPSGVVAAGNPCRILRRIGDGS